MWGWCRARRLFNRTLFKPRQPQVPVDSATVEAAAAGFANAGGVMEQTATLNNGQPASLLSTIRDETSRVNAIE